MDGVSTPYIHNVPDVLMYLSPEDIKSVEYTS